MVRQLSIAIGISPVFGTDTEGGITPPGGNFILLESSTDLILMEGVGDRILQE